MCVARTADLTFINKLDQPALDPFELLDQIERVLGLAAAPVNWPIGDGRSFQGRVRPRSANAVQLHARRPKAAGRLPLDAALDDAAVARLSNARGTASAFIDAVDIIAGAGTGSTGEYLAGRQTPVFFGSALERLRRRAVPACTARPGTVPQPRPRMSSGMVRADGYGLQRLRVQDSGEHGSRAPRPGGVRARVLGPLPAGNEGPPPAYRARDEARQRAHFHGERARCE